MKIALFSFAASLAAATLIASPDALAASKSTKGNGLLSYLVYSKTEIQSARSDYQGKTGAVERISLRDFQILGDLIAGDEVRFQRGEVRGAIITQSAVLKQVSHHGTKSAGASVQQKLSSNSLEMDRLALILDRQKATSIADSATEKIGEQTISGLKIVAQRDLEVVDLKADELIENRNLILEGQGDNVRLLVRISGKSIKLENIGFFVTKGLRPEQVVFHFVDAEELQISRSGGPRWGIPGTVLAPCARLIFSEALITGHVFAEAIESENGLNGGQVNAPGSLLLRELDGNCLCRR